MHVLVSRSLIHFDTLVSILVKVALGLGLSAGLDPVQDRSDQEQYLDVSFEGYSKRLRFTYGSGQD